MIELTEIKVADFIYKTIEENYRLSDLTNNEFKELIKCHLWESFIRSSFEWNTKNKFNLKNNFLSKKFINMYFENDLIWVYQSILLKLKDWDFSDLKINENLVIKWEELENVLKQISNIILTNNLLFIKKEVNIFFKSTVNFEKHIEWVTVSIQELIKNLEKFDIKKWIKYSTFIKLHIFWKIKSLFQDSLTWMTNLSKWIFEIYRTIKRYKEWRADWDSIDSWSLLNDIVNNLEKFNDEELKILWESYFNILSADTTLKSKFIEKYYKNLENKNEIFKNEDNIIIFRENIKKFIEESIDKKNLEKRVKNIWNEIDMISRNMISLDKENDEWDSFWSSISDETNAVDFWSKIDTEMWIKILRREIYQTKWYKCDLSLRDRIILGMCYDNIFILWEVFYLLEEYFEWKYPHTFITYLSIFWFVNKPTVPTMKHPKSLDNYWKQYFREWADAVSPELIGKILWLSKQWVVWIDIKTKDKLNKEYKFVWDDDEVYMEFKEYKYKELHKASKVLKENYKRLISQEEEDNMENEMKEYIKNKRLGK